MISAIQKQGQKDLTCISNNAGIEDYGIGLLLNTKQVKRMVSSYVGENKEFERQYLTGELEVELTPQGTLAERLRAGGAGIPAFFTPSGVGTQIEQGGFPIRVGGPNRPEILSAPKERRTYNGREFILQESVTGDFALVRAWKADTAGNLIWRKSQRNFNADCAVAGKICIAEVDEIVPEGTLDPDEVHLPSVYTHRIIKTEHPERRIEFRTTHVEGQKPQIPGKGHDLIGRERIVRRAAKELKDGMYVNLGIGIPTLCANFLEPGVSITLQSENGILGLGRFPTEEEVDADLINAGK